MDYKLVSALNKINGTISLSNSKSISNRLLIMKALSKNPFNIKNISDSKDSEVLINGLNSNEPTIDIGAAGTSMRFLTAYLALQGKERIITGSERMQNRPIAKLVNALKQLGCNIDYLKKEGYPPLKIRPSDIKTKGVSIDGSVSSQYITALLLIAPSLPQGLELTIENRLVSRAYVQLTLKLMEYQGIKYTWVGDNKIIISPQQYVGKDIFVEADWSGASYWYEIAALADNVELTLRGLEKNSLQGDSVTADIFKHFGVTTEFLKNEVRLTKQAYQPRFFEYDFSNCPDLVQTLTATCVFSRTPFKISGAETLRIKETDRITALQNELAKFGAIIKETSEGVLEWNGKLLSVTDKEICIKTYEDHRMAMAFAPGAIKFPDKIIIEDAGVVVKSYPEFWTHLKAIGFDIEKH